VTDETRIAHAKEQIRKRLKNVCSHLSEKDFELLVHKIAVNEVKLPTAGSGIDHWLLP